MMKDDDQDKKMMLQYDFIKYQSEAFKGKIIYY